MVNIGKMIAEIRRERGLSQNDLADRIGVSKQAVSNYERGTREPDYVTLEAIADALNVPVSMLISREDQQKALDAIYSGVAIGAAVDVGGRIRELREKLGMTQDDLAEKAGMNRVTIAKYESGRIEPSSRALPRLAKALGTSSDALLGIEPDAHPDPVMAEREALRRDPDRRVLLDLAERGTDADVKQVRAIIDALRATNPDFYDGDDPA